MASLGWASVTDTVLPCISALCSSSMACFMAFSSWNPTNPNPLDLPVCLSWITLASPTAPYLAKVASSSRSSMVHASPPTNTRCRLDPSTFASGFLVLGSLALASCFGGGYVSWVGWASGLVDHGEGGGDCTGLPAPHPCSSSSPPSAAAWSRASDIPPRSCSSSSVVVVVGGWVGGNPKKDREKESGCPSPLPFPFRMSHPLSLSLSLSTPTPHPNPTGVEVRERERGCTNGWTNQERAPSSSFRGMGKETHGGRRDGWVTTSALCPLPSHLHLCTSAREGWMIVAFPFLSFRFVSTITTQGDHLPRRRDTRER